MMSLTRYESGKAPAIYKRFKIEPSFLCGLGGLVVSALDFQAGYRGFEPRSGQDKFQTTSTPISYSMCSELSIKWTGRRLMTDSGKCACVIHESKAVQIHVHNNHRCLYVPRVPGSVKHPHNNNVIFISVRPTMVQLKKAAKLLILIVLTTRHAACHLTSTLKYSFISINKTSESFRKIRLINNSLEF